MVLLTSLQYLSVFGTDNVELFDGLSWKMAQSLPVASWFRCSVLHNGVWYLGGGGEQGREVFRATVQSIVDSTQRPTPSQVWTRLRSPFRVICGIVVLGQQLLAFNGDLSRHNRDEIIAYYSHTQSWVHVEDIPAVMPSSSSCALTLPTGDLMVVTDDGETWIGQLEGKECDYCACLQ